MFTLVDSSSTLSYVCSGILLDKGWEIVKINFDTIVLNLLGNIVVVNRPFRDAPLEIGGKIFPRDLLELRSIKFDVISGIDWLFCHRIVLDYRAKKFTLQTHEGIVTIIDDRVI